MGHHHIESSLRNTPCASELSGRMAASGSSTETNSVINKSASDAAASVRVGMGCHAGYERSSEVKGFKDL